MGNKGIWGVFYGCFVIAAPLAMSSAQPFDPRCPLTLNNDVIDTLKKDVGAKIALQGLDKGTRDFSLPLFNERANFQAAIPSRLNLFSKPFTLIKSEVKKTSIQGWLYCTFSRPATLKEKSYSFSLVWPIDE